MAEAFSAADPLSRAYLIAQLSQSLGEAKAMELIDTHARQLGFNSAAGFSKTQAMSLLEAIAKTPGLVGIVARGAQTRVILGGLKK